MARFVILEHDHPELHWDLMLECGEVLRTWRLSTPPVPGQSVYAEMSFDHRPLYLDYEGPVSGDRGRVKRWDSGSYKWSEGRADDPGAAGGIVFAGKRISCPGILAPAEAGGWLLTLA